MVKNVAQLISNSEFPLVFKKGLVFMIIDLCTFKKAVRNILQFRAYILSVKKRSQVCSDMFTTPVGNNKNNEL